MYYRIDPFDSWFFRSGAPYDAGVNTYGESIFPPFPSVYAGMLRNCDRTFSDEKTFSRRLRIGWNGIMINHQMLFPAPLDLTIIDHKEKGMIGVEKVLKPSCKSSYPLPYYLMQTSNQSKPPYIRGGAYIDQKFMNYYVNDNISEYPIRELGDYFTAESRIGISIDSSLGTVEKGKLFQQVVITPNIQNGLQKASLVLEAQGIELPDITIERIGGDGKVSAVSKVDAPLELPLAPSNIKGKNIFKLYMATPAVFEKGWIPGWINERSMVGSFAHKKHRVRVQLLSAAVGKFIPVGGFGYNMQKGKNWPKEMHYAVPAGSVYYFQIIEGSMDDVFYLFHKRCISDYREGLGFLYENGKLNTKLQRAYDRLRYCSRGFGYSLVCAVSQKQGGKIDHV